MKKSITICALAAGALALSSCSDFLDQNSPSELSQEHVFNNEYYTSAVINQIYGDLTNDRTYSQDWAILYGLARQPILQGNPSGATPVDCRKSPLQRHIWHIWAGQHPQEHS